MANVKLLRQQVTDYQRKYGLNRRNYEKSYEKYAADTEAFNTLIKQLYDASAAMNKKSDLDLVGATYYDRELGHNRDVYDDANRALPTMSFTDLTPVEGLPHNAYAKFVPTKYQRVQVDQNMVDGHYEPVYEKRVSGYGIEYNGQLLGNVGMVPTPNYYAPANSIGAYWDDYDKIWRNAPSGGASPTQRQTKAPNLTEKEIGILQGEVSPYSYAEIAKQDTSPTSVFADPEDPYNLKDAGVLTRAIAGKI